MSKTRQQQFLEDWGLEYSNTGGMLVTSHVVFIDHSLNQEREFPCSHCDDGEMRHISTSPGHHGSTMTYECYSCGHTESFP